MNDDNTFTAVRSRVAELRDSLGDVHMSIPAGEITARGRRRRLRRGLSVAGAAGAVAGLALGLPLTAASPAPAVHVHLTAWTVVTNSDGTVTVRLHQLTAAAGMPPGTSQAPTDPGLQAGREARRAGHSHPGRKIRNSPLDICI